MHQRMGETDKEVIMVWIVATGSFFVGVVFGIVLIALMSGGRDDDE